MSLVNSQALNCWLQQRLTHKCLKTPSTKQFTLQRNCRKKFFYLNCSVQQVCTSISINISVSLGSVINNNSSSKYLLLVNGALRANIHILSDYVCFAKISYYSRGSSGMDDFVVEFFHHKGRLNWRHHCKWRHHFAKTHGKKLFKDDASKGMAWYWRIDIGN